MRERMREKLKAARSRAESALLEEVSSSRSLKSFRERKSHIKLVNEVGEDEASVTPENESRISARVKLHDSARKMKQKSQIQTGYPSSEEAYNFFTFHFDHEPENVGEETQKKEKNISALGDEEGEDQESNIGHQEGHMEGETSEEEHLVRDKEDDDFFLLEEAAADFLVVKPADYESYSGRVRKEREVFFIPSKLRGVVVLLTCRSV
ncbi:UNVERIFIED_CONTAM: hypothetical protein K2H54_059557 [Gekko kuhli]